MHDHAAIVSISESESPVSFNTSEKITHWIPKYRVSVFTVQYKTFISQLLQWNIRCTHKTIPFYWNGLTRMAITSIIVIMHIWYMLIHFYNLSMLHVKRHHITTRNSICMQSVQFQFQMYVHWPLNRIDNDMFILF